MWNQRNITISFALHKKHSSCSHLTKVDNLRIGMSGITTGYHICGVLRFTVIFHAGHLRVFFSHNILDMNSLHAIIFA